MGGGWVVGLGFCKIKANSAQLELELGLSLAKRLTSAKVLVEFEAELGNYGK